MFLVCLARLLCILGMAYYVPSLEQDVTAFQRLCVVIPLAGFTSVAYSSSLHVSFYSASWWVSAIAVTFQNG